MIEIIERRVILLKYLLLAEKPDQAKKYANALGNPKKDKCVWRGGDICNS